MTTAFDFMLFRRWNSGFTSSERRPRPLASAAATLLLYAAGLGLLAAVLGATGAYAQPDSTSAPATPALYGTWSAGIQVSPLYGASVRYNLSRRVALQAAGLPIFWDGPFRGIVGGRALYRLIAREGYSFFAAGGVNIRFDDQIQLENLADLGDLGDAATIEKEVVAQPTVATAVGIETNLGDHVGLSAEIGGAYTFDDAFGKDDSGLRGTLGVGLHYYW